MWPFELKPRFYTIKKDGNDFEKTNTNHTTVLSKDQNGEISFILQPYEMSEICSFTGRIVEDPSFSNYMAFNLKEIKITTADSTILYAQGDNSRHIFSPYDEYVRAIIFR